MVKPDFEPKTIHSAGFLLMLEEQNQRIKFIIGSKVQENFVTFCHYRGLPYIFQIKSTIYRARQIKRSHLKSFEPNALSM